MRILQYANYQMAEWDKGLWRRMPELSRIPKIPSAMKIVFLFGLAELGIAAALDIVICHTIIARPVYIPSKPVIVVFVLALAFLTQSILGPESRVEHYRTIFNAWDKKKKMRWNLYLWMMALSSWALWIYAIREM